MLNRILSSAGGNRPGNGEPDGFRVISLMERETRRPPLGGLFTSGARLSSVPDFSPKSLLSLRGTSDDAAQSIPDSERNKKSRRQNVTVNLVAYM
jgi:hypothetical protein